MIAQETFFRLWRTLGRTQISLRQLVGRGFLDNFERDKEQFDNDGFYCPCKRVRTTKLSYGVKRYQYPPAWRRPSLPTDISLWECCLWCLTVLTSCKCLAIGYTSSPFTAQDVTLNLSKSVIPLIRTEVAANSNDFNS